MRSAHKDAIKFQADFTKAQIEHYKNIRQELLKPENQGKKSIKYSYGEPKLAYIIP